MSPSFTILIWVWVRVEIQWEQEGSGSKWRQHSSHTIPRPTPWILYLLYGFPPKESLNFFHWVRARTRLNKRILGYLGAWARGPKEKKLKFRHWLSNCMVHPFFVGNYPYNYPWSVSVQYIPYFCWSNHAKHPFHLVVSIQFLLVLRSWNMLKYQSMAIAMSGT